MHLHHSSLGLVVQAPAKLNLFFELIAKRSDGYHEIETLAYPIDLYDTLYFKEDRDGLIRLGCKQAPCFSGSDGAEIGEVPEGKDNLVVRAVELLRRRAGAAKGATIRLVKRIPSEAGLGGGSSDAAAALVAANIVWGLGWSSAELGQLGAELGSDVPLFLASGAAWCRGRGELIESQPGTRTLHFVVIRPPAGLSTAAVYRASTLPRTPHRADLLRQAITLGDPAAVGRLLFNRLEPAARDLSPWIERLQHEFTQTDCLGYQMTGSGTCYFGLCRHARHARRVARCLQARRIGVAYTVRGSR